MRIFSQQLVSLEGTGLVPGGSSCSVSHHFGLILMHFRGECAQVLIPQGDPTETWLSPPFPLSWSTEHPLPGARARGLIHGQDFQGWAPIIGNNHPDVPQSAETSPEQLRTRQAQQSSAPGPVQNQRHFVDNGENSVYWCEFFNSWASTGWSWLLI